LHHERGEALAIALFLGDVREPFVPPAISRLSCSTSESRSTGEVAAHEPHLLARGVSGRLLARATDAIDTVVLQRQRTTWLAERTEPATVAAEQRHAVDAREHVAALNPAGGRTAGLDRLILGTVTNSDRHRVALAHRGRAPSH
jgi:hypothetical protein